MNELNENKIHEKTGSAGSSSEGINIVKNNKLDNISMEMGAVMESIDNNAPISIDKLKELEKNLGGIMVDVGGEQMTLAQVRKIPDFEKNKKIWDEVILGNFDNYGKLSHLTPRVAKELSVLRHGINLRHVTSLSVASAEELANCNATIWLDGLLTIDEKVAEVFSKHKGNIGLGDQIEISDRVAQIMAKKYNLNSGAYFGPPHINQLINKYKNQ